MVVVLLPILNPRSYFKVYHTLNLKVVMKYIWKNLCLRPHDAAQD
jgi:hypothetical protein